MRNAKGQFVKGHMGYVTPEGYAKSSLKLKGRKIDWADKISQSLKGNTNSKGKPKPKEAIDKIRGDRNVGWKGESVSYVGYHKWIFRNLGSPTKCAKCGLKGKKVGRQWNIEWANKDHKYKRDLNDVLPMCHKCHDQYDRKLNLRRDLRKD